MAVFLFSSNVNSKFFQKLTKPYFLTENCLVIFLQIERNLVRSWLQGKVEPPEAIGRRILNLRYVFDGLTDDLINYLMTRQANELVLLRFTDEDDLFQFFPHAGTLQTVLMYEALIRYMVKRLKAIRMTVHLVDFDRERYLSWLDSEQRENSTLSQRMWAVTQLQDRDADRLPEMGELTA